MTRTVPSISWAPQTTAATLLAGVLALGCQSATQPVATAKDAPSATPASAAASAPIIRQDTVAGIYEVAYRPTGDSVFVASTPDFDAKTPGYVHRLDGLDLSPKQVIQLPRRAFALGLNTKTDTLYVGNTLDGSLSVVDARGGMVTATIQLGTPDAKGEVAHTRKVLVDEARNRVFVTSPGQPGKIWIVDGAKGTLTHTIDSPAPWSAGVAYDEQANRVYVGQGGVEEILVIDPDAGTIVQRFATGDGTGNDRDGSKHFFINLALDAKGKRLFASDATTNRVYVFDIASGKVLTQIPVGIGLLDLAFNAHRGEIYATHRGVSRGQPAGTGALTIIDAASYKAKRTIDLPPHPNSVVVTPDGKTAYVTVKVPHDKEHPSYRTGAVDGIVRIDLGSVASGS